MAEDLSVVWFLVVLTILVWQGIFTSAFEWFFEMIRTFISFEICIKIFYFYYPILNDKGSQETKDINCEMRMWNEAVVYTKRYQGQTGIAQEFQAILTDCFLNTSGGPNILGLTSVQPPLHSAPVCVMPCSSVMCFQTWGHKGAWQNSLNKTEQMPK